MYKKWFSTSLIYFCIYVKNTVTAVCFLFRSHTTSVRHASSSTDDSLLLSEELLVLSISFLKVFLCGCRWQKSLLCFAVAGDGGCRFIWAVFTSHSHATTQINGCLCVCLRWSSPPLHKPTATHKTFYSQRLKGHYLSVFYIFRVITSV